MHLKAVVALVLLLTGCGGKSAGSVDDDARAAAAQGGSRAGAGHAGDDGEVAGSGTMSTPGGATSTGSGGVTTTDPGECDLNELGDGCVEGCGVDLLNVFPPICVARRWECPEGFVSMNQCSEQSCARAQRSCCDAELGSIKSAPCVEGTRLECPVGTAALPLGASACRPPGVTDCSELYELSCSDDALECHNGQRCGTTCTCDSSQDGSLVWVCLTPLC